MAYNSNITPGAPPLLWSNVQEALVQINENFDILAATVGVGELVDFETLETNVSPTNDNERQLGSPERRWKSVRTAEYSDVPGDELNGLWAGTAQIKGKIDSIERPIIELPVGSTVGGNLIIDPLKPFFKSVQVDNDLSIEATGDGISQPFGDTLNLLSGDGIQMTVSSGADSITIENTGVISLSGSTYLQVTEPTQGDFVLTNTGVTNIANTTVLPSGRSTGAGVHVDSSTGTVRITNTGVISIESGNPAITVTTSTSTGLVTITNNAPDRPAFAFIQVAGQSNIEAGGILSTLTVAAGYGIRLTTNTVTKTLSVGLDTTRGAIDLRASIFADDSTLLVNAVDGNIPAEVLVGTFTGSVVGPVSGTVTGNLVGNADSSTVASTVTLTDSSSASGSHFVTFVDTVTGNEAVRTDTDLTYNPNTNTLSAATFSGNLSGNVTGNVTGNADTATAATKVTLLATNTAAGTYYPTFVDAATGDEEVRTDTSLTYNPSTNTLTANNFAGNLVGNTTGFHSGDVKGSVFGDDSSVLVDGVDGKITGRVETTTVQANTYIQTAVYTNATARNLGIPSPARGMIVFNTATSKFEGNIDGTVSGWVDLN